METSPPPVQPPSHFAPASPPPKKGLGAGAWIGIGCGGIVVLIILGIIIVTVMFGPQLKKLAGEMQQNPTRTTAEMMVSTSRGKMEMTAQDDVNKRYTVKDKQSGSLITIYWDTKTNSAKVIPGDFSAIPAPAATPAPAGSPSKLLGVPPGYPDTATPAPASKPAPDAGK